MKTKNDPLTAYIMTLPHKEDYEYIKICDTKKNKQLYMNREHTIGIGFKTLAGKEYLANTAQLSWPEFRLANTKNMITGKFYYQEKYIRQITKILNHLNIHPKYDPMIVFFPQIMSPAMITIEGEESGLAFFISPCTAAESPQIPSTQPPPKETQ